MGAKQNNLDKYVKKETMLVVAVIALIAGFLGGVVLTVYKSGAGLPSQESGPSPQHTHKDQVTSTKLAAKIFELEKELSQHSDDFTQWTHLGNLYYDTDNFDKAIMAYKKSLELNPDDAAVLTALGVMYRRSGQPAEAIKAFDKAIKANPRHEVSRFNKGIVLMHDLNDVEGAIKAWEDLAELNPAAMSPGGKPVAELIQRFKQNK